MTYFGDRLYQRLKNHVGHDIVFKQHKDEQPGGYLQCKECNEGPLFEFDEPLSEHQWAGLTSDGLRMVSFLGENVAVTAGHEVLLDVEPEEYHPENIEPISIGGSNEASREGGE